MNDHVFPIWAPLERINDETYITTIAGFHIVISRTGYLWKYSCDFAGIHDIPLRNNQSVQLSSKSASLDDVKAVALRKVERHMCTRISGYKAFLRNLATNTTAQ